MHYRTLEPTDRRKKEFNKYKKKQNVKDSSILLNFGKLYFVCAYIVSISIHILLPRTVLAPQSFTPRWFSLAYV